MKKIIFSIMIILLFAGCSSKETTLFLPIKGNKKSFKCKNINIDSNNQTIKKIFQEEAFNIITSPNNNVCKIYIKNNTLKKITSYSKKIKILYDKHHPRCTYYKQTCILKGEYYFCSKTEKISPQEYKTIQHFKYRYQNYYLNSPNSNTAYKIFKKCHNEFFIINCKKGYFKITNIYFLNHKKIYTQNDFIPFDTCENIDNTAYYYEINNIKQNVNSKNENINKYLINGYKNEIYQFIKNFFPHQEVINIELIDPESKNKEIEKIYNNLIKNQNITYNDLTIIENYLKKQKKKNKEYLAIEIMKYALILKLKDFDYINQKTLKELNELLKISKKNKFEEIYEILEKIKRIIYKIYK